MKRPLQLDNSCFTLPELLIVLTIIVLLIGLLVPAVNEARRLANRAATKAQLHSIASAIESYRSSFKAYPGFFSEQTLRNPDRLTDFTSTENLTISLMGRVGTKDGDQDEYVPTDPPGWFNNQNLAIELAGVGSGPRAVRGRSGRQYEPFYSPKSRQLAWAASGGSGGSYDLINPVPELVDQSTGMPILYWRATGGNYPVQREGDQPPGRINVDANRAYFRDSRLATGEMKPQDLADVGSVEFSQTAVSRQGSSLLRPANGNRHNDFAWFTTNEQLSNYDNGPNGPKDILSGAYYLMTPGSPGIYLDGNTLSTIDAKNDTNQFKDILIQGGAAD